MNWEKYLRPQPYPPLVKLLDERKTAFDKLVQACQSGSKKAWRKRRKEVDILNAKLRELNMGYGDEDTYKNFNSKDGLTITDTSGNKIN